MTDHVTVLSLGGGVQSTVLGLLCDRDPAFPTPDFAVHAVTGWDPPSVLERVEWLAGQVSYPVEIVQSRLGDIRDAVRSPAGPTAFVPIPTFLTAGGVGRRQCTRQWKIEPIQRAIRERCGWVGKRLPPGICTQLLGISTDEIQRMRPSLDRWQQNTWPLIDARMSRADCNHWWDDHIGAAGPPLGRSSCVGCPYHTSREWVGLAATEPDMIAESAEIEKAMQAAETAAGSPVTFLHHRRIPLREAIEKDRARIANIDAQQSFDFGSDEECDGHCGV